MSLKDFFLEKKEEKVNLSQNELRSKFIILIVLDGFGIHPDPLGNAVIAAKTPFLDRVWSLGRSSLLYASGTYVGLPDYKPGDSEVGHLSMGTGQVIYQSLSRINDAIADGKFEEIDEIKQAMSEVKMRGCNLHLLGVLSAAGVHGHIDHLFALMDMAKKNGINPLIHVITDGRDTQPNEGAFFLAKLNEKIKTLGIGRIASIGGRFYGMDRNNVWERTEKTYNSMMGLGERKATDAIALINECYENNEFDEKLIPTTMVNEQGSPVGVVKDNDVILFYNFREDRAKQLTKVFVDEEFRSFPRLNYPKNLYFVTMTGYSEELNTHVIFHPKKVSQVAASVISNAGLKQFHIAESEKFTHVTYFFNGGNDKIHGGEEFFNIPSPTVSEYSDAPQMSAYQIRDEVVARLDKIDEKKYSFILINFANPDMVGHTGNLTAAIKACEVVDECCKDVVRKTIEKGGSCIIVSDHGNCETMIDRKTQQPDNQHTTNPVPFVFIDKIGQVDEKIDLKITKIGTGINAKPKGVLSDITTTILPLLGLKKDKEMTGVNLLDTV
ncbi:2,3-bisphosphoglycerate-independent phosphoglycerate mutase [Candidatus Dojkabacteria bacterium]|jgi:2,3-bisphosphoglycerate-independent phosphoglycerate mutase|nr:2,3-bisphosphoglycerate-independent phosphoglycerate mutase [Candidatus Dojkabacteria bacterium]